MDSDDAHHCCPSCAGDLIYRDRRKRICRELNGEKNYLMVRRLRCRQCGKLCSELPDCILPHKHYTAEVIHGVLKNRITANDEVGEDYPSPDTMRRWKRGISVYDAKAVYAPDLS